MRKVTKTVYTFDELKPEVQERVIERNRRSYDSYMVDNSLNCELDFHWIPKLEAMGFEDPEIAYRGFGSQGDGASFTADINIEKLINTFIMCDILPKDRLILYHKLLKMMDLNIIELYYMVRRTSLRYVHENSVYVDNDSEFYLYKNRQSPVDYFEKVFNQLKADIADFVCDLCQEIYMSLEKEYHYIMSDEFQIQEIEFYANGDVYYE